jgi:hypothetical protein
MTLVRAGLQRDVGGDFRDRVALRLRITQRHDFGVRATSAKACLMCAFMCPVLMFASHLVAKHLGLIAGWNHGPN